MARTTLAHDAFATVRSEGGLLPPDLLARIAGNDPILKGLDPADYGLAKSERLNDAAARAWANVRTYWAAFQAATGSLPDSERGLTETREQWLLPLFRELGYGRLVYRPAAEEIGNRRYAISHQAGDDGAAPPIQTVSFRDPIDKPGPRAVSDGTSALRVSPHGLVQEYLNRTDHLWGVLSNGHQLRLLRDNASLSRAAFVEFNLKAMLEDGAYADFVLLFLLLHRSRLPGVGQAPEECWLERWRAAAEDEGARALDELRAGVDAAIRVLGQGLLEHPANGALRERLIGGGLPVVGYYRQLLRLVYRLLFLLAAEDRVLLFEPDADPRRVEVYRRHYGVGRLRELVEQRRHADRYDDLWRSLQVTFGVLRGDEAAAVLGVKPLAGGLFDAASCPDLDGALVANVPLLDAVRGLTWFTERQARRGRRVNYRDMDIEELGSVYEGLLELQPVLRTAGDHPSFELGSSGERKSTGSYYTNQGLVRELVASALEPVIAVALARGGSVAEQRANLLALNVCDPACGSGHFLLAAARRIGREVARLDAGDTEPDPAQARQGVREAIAHCIYGVDQNPLAVDLCKLALWLEGHSPGKPLGFLEHRIKQGNSLVGATEAALAEGVPDEAFDPVTGDDRTYARGVKGRNRQERRGNAPLPMEYHPTSFTDPASVHRYFTALREDEETLEEAAEKARIYNQHQRSPEMFRQRLTADLWTAAFFWPLQAGEADPPTQGAWQRLARDPHLIDYITKGKADAYRTTASYRTVRLARDLSWRHDFFHWHLEFEEVFALDDPGFDCILGNPPWDQIQLDPQEHFRVTAPDIADAPNFAARARRIERLREANPSQYRNYELAVRDVEGVQGFIHQSARYPKTSFGRLNTAPLFAELVTVILRSSGRAGIIVPSGIATDSFNQYFFRWLVDEGHLVSLFDFENRDGIFPGVHRSYKFSLLTTTGAERPAAPFEAAFFLLQPAELRDPERRFTLAAAEIALLNPNTRTCPIFRTARDAELTKQLYRAAPVLVREGDNEDNPWGVTFKLMFMMNTASHLFRTRAELEGAGAHLDPDGRFRNGNAEWLPLYEAKLIHQFDHRFATYEGPPEAERARDLTPAEHADPSCVALPRYWVDEREVERAASSSNGRHTDWFLGFRDITNSTNERTAIFSIVPWAGVANSLPILEMEKPAAKVVCALQADCSSFAFDFATRQKAGGTHLNFFIVKQLPVLPPETYTPALLDQIVPRVLELVYTAHDMAPFVRDCGYDGPPFVWDEERRVHLRAELDGIYAHLYGLSRDDFAYILDTFPIVKRKDEAAFGEYRTRRLCLEAYDYFAPETLHDLHAEVKAVEVALRNLILRTLGPAADGLPPEMREKLVEEQKKQLGNRVTPGHATSTAALLESALLLDLQRIILASETWPRVEASFGSKSALRDAFSHINELRNPLAHTRSMDDRSRIKGEQAVRWFKQALGLT